MSRKQMLFALLFLIGSVSGIAQKSYRFTINLNKVKDDKLEVVLMPPSLSKNTVTYSLPKIVPGTYSEDDYGRYVESFKALTKKGDTLPVERIDINSWQIKDAQKLHKITYWVNDSFDDSLSKKKLFEPTGSNILEGKNFMLNTHCFFGYFNEMKEIPFEVEVLHPADLYGTTALKDIDKNLGRDLFKAANYNYLVDNPIMYASPDTATIRVGKSEVLIGVYSPNKKVSASFLAEKLDKLLKAQVAYMGGTMPVDKYAFLIYFTDKPGLSGAQGALEHSYSSMYFMPEGTSEATVQFFLDVAAHEFFHIITPLNLHAEQIHYFDFNNPSMSAHLWLYEGTTEYHAHLAQVRYGLISKDAFLKQMQNKITSSKNNFNDQLPFTVMSEGVLHSYANQFGNVYQKGALIAMCLDIMLRKESNGKTGVIDLINALSKQFGKNKPFKDGELFNAIEKLSSPSIKTFLEKHVAGSAPLPLNDVFEIVGVNYLPVVETKDSVFTMGGVSFNPNSDGKLVITDISKMNDFGKLVGYEKGDILEDINGTSVTAQTAGKVVGALFQSAKVNDVLTITVSRKNASGNLELIKLATNMQKIPVKKFNVLEFKKDRTEGQKQICDQWLTALQ